MCDGPLVPAGGARHSPGQVGEPGLLGFVGAQLGGPNVSGLGRLGSTYGPGPLGGLGVGVSLPDPQLAGVRVVLGGEVRVILGEPRSPRRPLHLRRGRRSGGARRSLDAAPCGRLWSGVVGDGSDERLGEGVLSPFWRELVGADRQHLLSHKRAQQLIEQTRVEVGDRLDGMAGGSLVPSTEHSFTSRRSSGPRPRGGGDRERSGPGISSSSSSPTEMQGTFVGFCDAPLSRSPATVSMAYSGMPSARSTMRLARSWAFSHEAVQQLTHGPSASGSSERSSRSAGNHEPLTLGHFRARHHEEEDGVVARPFEEVVQKVDHAGDRPIGGPRSP